MTTHMINGRTEYYDDEAFDKGYWPFWGCFGLLFPPKVTIKGEEFFKEHTAKLPGLKAKYNNHNKTKSLFVHDDETVHQTSNVVDRNGEVRMWKAQKPVGANMDSKLYFDTVYLGGDCVGELRKGDKLLARSRVPVTEGQREQAERLATIIVTERALEKFEELPLPPTAKATLQLVHTLVRLKYAAMSGEQGAEKQAAAAIQAAKQSPIRAVRAAAAGIEEFLK